MISACQELASWRSTLVLLFVTCGCFYHSACLVPVDAFAPPLLHSPNSIIAPKIDSSRQHFSHIQTFGSIHGRGTNHLHASNDEESGIPSTPLDRPVLSAIDAVSLLVFAGVGKASHSAVDGSLDLIAVLVTAFPFLVSWFLVAPLVGSYTPQATKDVPSAVVQTAKGWALAVPLGCLLRGVIKGYVPPVSFVVVTLIATLVILSIGRVGYTFLSELYVEMF